MDASGSAFCQGVSKQNNYGALAMLKMIREFCLRFPWLIILLVLLISGGAIFQIRNNLYFEGDVTKFLPGDLKAVKANDYSQKNFNYQERVLIGIDYPAGSILEPAVLRNIEQIVLGLTELKAQKSFESQLTGKTENLLLPIGIDTEDIISIANLEDTILDRESGSVVAGSFIEKLKQDYEINSPPGLEERLPQSDIDLQRITPALKKRIQKDRIFNGSILSEDEHAATIQIPMIRKWDYKRRFALLELETAMDPQKLKSRFEGNDSTFPFTVYGKTYANLTIDDDFIKKHTDKVSAKLRSFLLSELEPVLDEYPDLEKALNGKMSPSVLKKVLQSADDRDFFLDPKNQRWENFTNDLYEFTLEVIDPLSRENLEFKFFDVRDIYNLKVNYGLITELVEKYKQPGINIHIAGQPVTVALISYMMRNDMRKMMPIAVGIIFLVLIATFRNIPGLVIPLLTVVITVIWTLGLMALTGVPLSISTTSMPIILLAIGTAYGIHLLNRYFSEIDSVSNRPAVINRTFKEVGPAVIMAAMTTIAGFGSLSFSSLPNMQHFGIFSATGVAIALVLSFTLTPAILMLTKNGIRKNKTTLEKSEKKGHSEPNSQTGWPLFVIKRPKTILSLVILVGVLAVIGTLNNYFEGDPIITFETESPLYQADQFVNRSLTGTNMINLVFRFRDRILLEDSEAVEELTRRAEDFDKQWLGFINDNQEFAETPLKNLSTKLMSLAMRDQPNPESIERELVLIRDILNEEFTAENNIPATLEEPSSYADDSSDASTGAEGELVDDLESLTDGSAGDLNDLGDLGDLSALGEEPPQTKVQGGFSGINPGQLSGLKDIASRLNISETEQDSFFKAVIAIRETKYNDTGMKMQRAFNLLQDFFVVDVKQPLVLHKLEELYGFLKGLEEPVVIKGGEQLKPTGLITSPVDLIRKVYKTFYHDDDSTFDRLPDTTRDGFKDITLTDRSLIGVSINQAQSSNRDMFDSMVTADHKEFQMQILMRSGSSRIIDSYVQAAMAETSRLFPGNDPYIDRILIGGMAPQLREVTGLLMDSQLKSIAGSFVLVWIVTFFIFRSALGGLFSLIPLGFTVLLNFGMMYALGWPLTQGTVIIASIAIGIGIDYTIHFLERFKIQIRQGDSLKMAYFNTVRTSGRAIFINAISVTLGFMVLIFSDFIPITQMGFLMMGTMLFSTLGAMIILPIMIVIIQPSFIKKQNGNNLKVAES